MTRDEMIDSGFRFVTEGPDTWMVQWTANPVVHFAAGDEQAVIDKVAEWLAYREGMGVTGAPDPVPIRAG